MGEIEEDIVLRLKQKPFCSLKFGDKLWTVKKGRPCPPLLKLTAEVSERNKVYTRRFTANNYEMYKWLCGSECLSKLFCWPCLLFSKDTSKNIWISNGFCNLSGLTKSAKAHEKSENHLQCVVDLYIFGKDIVEDAVNSAVKVNNILHNQKVKKNREVLKRLIDVTCFLAKQELPFSGHNEMDHSFCKENFVETVNLLKRWDSELEKHLDHTTVFKDISTDIQSDLIHIISEVVKETILKEIENSDFVSVMLDETSDVRSRYQLSTVLRYVHKEEGCIKERFIGFSDASADRTANGLLLHVKNVVKKYNLENKFIAQAYDGAVVMPGQLAGLQKKVQEMYPNALFTHCYAHVLNLVLSQGMNEISECNIFFSTLNSISTFSSDSSKSTFALQEHLKKSIPSFSPTRWCFTSSLLNTLEKYREAIIDFFSIIYENNDGKWKGSDRCIAYGFVQFLRSFQTVFLLNTFAPLFTSTDVIFNILQSEHIDINRCLNALKGFEEELNLIRKGFVYCEDCKKKLVEKTILEGDKCEKCETIGFNVVWKKSISMLGSPSPTRKRKLEEMRDNLSPEQKYRRLYFSIIDNLLCHVDERFASLQKLTFFDLLNPRKFKSYSATNCFPETLLADLLTVYPNVFESFLGLKNELTVFYRTPTFQNKSPCELVTFFKQENLDNAFKEIFRLAKLICTIPATTASVERNFSALKRIHIYKISTQGEEQMNNLALLSIEKELLESIQGKEDFYKTVIDKFAIKTRRLEFLYK